MERFVVVRPEADFLHEEIVQPLTSKVNGYTIRSVTRQVKRFREVGYLDDGVSRFQCLACKQKWDARSSPGPFCSYCGIRWNGELVWQTDERQARDLIREQASFRPGTLNHGMQWVLQYRSVWGTLEVEGNVSWEDEFAFDASVGAVRAFAILRDKRKEREGYDDDTFRIEYRMILRPSSDAKCGQVG